MQPGLTRAIPMAIIGFLLASLVVIGLRALQQLEPLWAPGPGFVLSAFVSAGFFVWGMGAFDPKMSVHGEHAEEEHHEEEAPKPAALLTGQIWTVLTLLIVALVPLMLFAAFGGLNLTTTRDALASTTAVGYFPVELFGRELLISELVVFVAFVLVMIVSLALAAGAFGWLMTYLSRSIAEVKAAPNAPLSAATPGGAVVVESGRTSAPINLTTILNFVVTAAILTVISYFMLIGLALVTVFMLSGQLLPEVAESSGTLLWLVSALFAVLLAYWLVITRQRTLAVFLIVFFLLYNLFYFVLIGLALPAFVAPNATILGLPMAEAVNVALSLVNALIFAFLLVRPSLLLLVVGRVAGWVARLLRRIPVLFQR